MKSPKPIAVMVAILLLIGAVAGFTANPAAATPPTTDSFLAARFGAQWLITQADPSGAIGGSTATSSVYNGTAQAVLALTAARQGEPTVDAAVAWLEANADDLASIDASQNPGFVGLVGTLLLVADNQAIDPTDFGGVDLVATLDDTLQPSGLYGDTDATYDGVYRQSLALMGLAAVGAKVPEGAVDWLTDQQCGSTATDPVTPPAAIGGWEDFRADTSVACSAPDPDNWMDSGPDTNSTALAIQALAVVGEPATADPLVYLASVQDPISGGFAFISGPGVDANSTAVVIQAIVASGGDVTDPPWQRAGGNPLTSLLSWQIGCGDATSVGAFQANWAPGANFMATVQGVWGAAEAELTDLPTWFDGRAAFTDVCEDNNIFIGEIASVGSWDVIRGFADGTFRPTLAASRQAMAAFFYRSSGEPPFTPTGQTFDDVAPTHPFYKEIEWAVASGIVVGFGDGTFRPTTPASRQATAAFFYRQAGSPSYTPTGQSFTDVAPNHAFYEEIEWLVSIDVIDGFSDGTFRPTLATSRQAAAAYLVRFD